jgi:hypothetical protein
MLYHHHQPINVPTAGAQVFLMDYPQGERAITCQCRLVSANDCKFSRGVLPKHGGALDNKFLVTHPTNVA